MLADSLPQRAQYVSDLLQPGRTGASRGCEAPPLGKQKAATYFSSERRTGAIISASRIRDPIPTHDVTKATYLVAAFCVNVLFDAQSFSNAS